MCPDPGAQMMSKSTSLFPSSLPFSPSIFQLWFPLFWIYFQTGFLFLLAKMGSGSSKPTPSVLCVRNDKPIQEPITVARGIGYADWPGLPLDLGVGELIPEPYR